jgi:hypothetical protein
VVFQSSFTDSLPDLPILDRFVRVVLGNELDQPRLAEDFLSTDLIHAVLADRAAAPVASDW